MLSPEDFFEQLAAHDARIALSEGARSLTYRALLREVERRAALLCDAGAQRVALALDNGIEWVLWDLALLKTRRVAVPLPAFFSATQQAHVLASAGVDTLIADDPAVFAAAGFVPSRNGLAQRTIDAPPLPDGTAKITYTSGTTGQPKGVCLSLKAQLAVANSLWLASAPCDIRRHLCVLPLATLLENVAGVYAPLLAGAAIELMPVAEVGLSGATGFDVRRFVAALAASAPNSMILVPQLLFALVAAAEHGAPLPPSLRFIAVGGARVAPSLLQRADALGLPVFEGYGLSECASVVCLNTPDARRIGTVGKPLPHVDVAIGDAGEVRVRGLGMLGYVGEPARDEADLDTGDLGRFDDGFLVLEGRRKHQFATAYGRKVNPEWVEAELAQQPAIAQAWLYGDALPANVALLVPRRAEVADAALQAAVDAVNATLPDYARAHRWLRAAPFTSENGLATANGRLRRDALFARYGREIDALVPTHSTPGGNP